MIESKTDNSIMALCYITIQCDTLRIQHFEGTLTKLGVGDGVRISLKTLTLGKNLHEDTEHRLTLTVNTFDC